MKAVDRYRSPHGAPFEAFASLLVRGELLHYLRRGRARPTTLSFESAHAEECRSPDDGIGELLDRLTVEAMLRPLSPLERRIVVGIHLECRTVVELAARLGYSRRHVTRLHRLALERLRAECEVASESPAERRSNVSVSHRG
jgi:RNA polymerase sigma factor (sigma-70 family)